MKIFRLAVVSALASLLVSLVACSSDSSSSSSTSDACNQAKSVADACNANAPDTGAQVSFTVDVSQCESGGDQGRKIAQCMVDNKSNCDCLLKCVVNGGSC